MIHGAYILVQIRSRLMEAEAYRAWVQSIHASNQQFRDVSEYLRGICEARKTILNFSHHDLDGVTSAAILKVGLEKLGAKVETKLPMGFQLSLTDVKNQLKEIESPEAVVVTDRGTDDIFDEIAKLPVKVILVDHHPSRTPAKSCLWFNPSIANGDQTAAAHLCHMLVTILGLSNLHLDFYALLGCRGDFAFDPVTSEKGKFVEPFIKHAQGVLPNLFEVIRARPTRYDVAFRDRTARINQIAEILNASCFAHEYSARSTKLGAVYGPSLCLGFLTRTEQENWPLRDIAFHEVDDWIESLDEAEMFSEIFRLYTEDWERAMNEMRKITRIGLAGETAIHFVAGRGLALLPLAASIKLHELKRSLKMDILILVLHESSFGFNISARATGLDVHCGFLMSTLAKQIADKLPASGNISGGGHAKAGECIVPISRVSKEKILRELTTLIQEITLIDDLHSRGTLTKGAIERAEHIGLKYVAKN